MTYKFIHPETPSVSRSVKDFPNSRGMETFGRMAVGISYVNKSVGLLGIDISILYYNIILVLVACLYYGMRFSSLIYGLTAIRSSPKYTNYK
jgi:hypothetical protein